MIVFFWLFLLQPIFFPEVTKINRLPLLGTVSDADVQRNYTASMVVFFLVFLILSMR